VRRRLVVALALVAATATAVPEASGGDLVVETATGPVQGVATESMHEWRGIPYAAPPVGDLRWRPPAPVTPWTEVRDATRFRAPCMQPAFVSETEDYTATRGRESCLFLNVFAPPDATETSSLPVMVHLHPGGNYFGQAYRDPSAFVERGVVVVTLAYRLGIFGWGGHEAMLEEPGNHPGEYGMLDQIAALEWVQANIAAFGGDPDTVTVFGSSAGSFDAVALMVSPLTEGLVDRAAIQGEAFWSLTGKRTRIRWYLPGIGKHTARLTGCNHSADVVGCLRSRPARELVLIEGRGDVGPLVGGVVLPESPIELLEDGPRTPLLVGFDREETRYFFLPFPIPDPFSVREYREATTILLGPELADEGRARYPASAYDSRAWAFVALHTDTTHGCPTRRLANAADGPTWRYLYTNVYEDLDGGDGRAAHVFEEPLLWHTPVVEWFGVDFPLTPGEELLSDRMTDYWTNFARTGNPNGPGLPAWPSYDTATEPTLVLDEEVGIVNRYHAEQCAFLDTVPVPFP
jgi:para-nitrobenzyl esterase